MRIIFIRFILIGLVLNIVGLFLPWGKEYYLPVFSVGQGYMYGIELLLGTQVIVGCIIIAVSSFLSIKTKKKYWLVLILLGGLFAIYSILTWIFSPSTEALHWAWVNEYGFTLVSESRGYIRYSVDYGAYISLIGSIITSISAIICLLSEAFFKKAI